MIDAEKIDYAVTVLVQITLTGQSAVILGEFEKAVSAFLIFSPVS